MKINLIFITAFIIGKYIYGRFKNITKALKYGVKFIIFVVRRNNKCIMIFKFETGLLDI